MIINLLTPDSKIFFPRKDYPGSTKKQIAQQLKDEGYSYIAYSGRGKEGFGNVPGFFAYKSI